ncbi:hypothetical protein BC939DRAFT_452930 [Gamsiella multidivaricata]|uniref:uncharacterized protein n=1 Tax=Gamsiella multidivaricata TaxID=101098 RepID=UPI00221E5267|nr:uncharacterized protein BC939DRAFT_452930 [Gamsiella multidivaricata]KAI7822897.1 hypothetical protein BC939DRAFT_452930 [Gamsiella multidivaricata]
MLNKPAAVFLDVQQISCLPRPLLPLLIVFEPLDGALVSVQDRQGCLKRPNAVQVHWDRENPYLRQYHNSANPHEMLVKCALVVNDLHQRDHWCTLIEHALSEPHQPPQIPIVFGLVTSLAMSGHFTKGSLLIPNHDLKIGFVRLEALFPLCARFRIGKVCVDVIVDVVQKRAQDWGDNVCHQRFFRLLLQFLAR